MVDEKGAQSGTAEAKSFNPIEKQNLEEWVLWAKKHAFRINPLSASLPFEDG
jgi:hypothetical protein